MMREIVGAMIGTTITNKRESIMQAVTDNAITQWLSRDQMQFMAAMDLGQNWQLMATGPTLFCLDDNGEPMRKKP